MRVIQILPTLGWGDAVGNDTRAIYRILKEEGFDTVIGAEAVDRRIPKDEAAELKDLPKIRPVEVIGVEDGYCFDLGAGHEIELIHLPGHAPGGIGQHVDLPG